jgi:sulfoxide reductase heme-binding subunit YedZ
MLIPNLPNVLGLGAVIGYILTLTPGLFRVNFPQTKSKKWFIWLTKHRRSIGIISFGFGLAHGIVIGIQRQLDFTKLSTYINYFQGITLLTIFTLLAITSNDWSVRHLKRNWKRLHSLTYLCMFLLVWHVVDKMQPGWTWVTPIALALTLIYIVLFVKRKWIESRNLLISKTRQERSNSSAYNNFVHPPK